VAAWLRLLAGARTRWRAWVALALLVGSAGGVVLASLAGAARTESAYDRFLKWSNASDLALFNAANPLDLSEIRKLPEVEEALDAKFAWMVGTTGESVLDPVFTTSERGFTAVDRPKLLAGRRPDPRRVDEAAISPVAQRVSRLHVGSTVTLDSLSPDQLEQAFEGQDLEPAGPTFTFRIVGIEAQQGEFVLDASLHLTPAFARRHGDEVATVDLLAVKLHRGAADLPAFKEGAERIAGGQPVEFETSAEAAAEVNRTLRVQAVSLRVFGLLAGLASLVILSQALAREAFDEAVDHRTLRSLGMSRFQLWSPSLLRVVAIAVPGAVVAAAVATVVSPFTVFGLARETDPRTGGWVDVPTVLAGTAVVVLLVVVAGCWPAWRLSRWGTAGDQSMAGLRALPSRAVVRLARAGAPASTVAGVRMALEPGRGRTAVPTRAALVGTTLSLAALVSAFTFGSSLNWLLATPRLYGWDWDAIVGSPFDEDTSDRVVPALEQEDSIAEFASVSFAEVAVGRVRARAFAFDPVKGSVRPPIVEGREPRTAGEILVGTRTLRSVGRSIGDTIDVRVGDRRAPMRIVGRGVLPSIGESDEGALGVGAVVTREGLARLVPESPVNLFAVRYADHVTASQGEAILEELGFGYSAARPPKSVTDFARVDKLPGVLSALLMMIAAATLAHTLMAGVRRRRRDLAILKTLGFVRRQVRAAVGWQATSLVVVAMTCGLPLGLAGGRLAWRLFADELGIVPEPVVPVLAVVLVVPATVLVANLLAALPGRSAASIQPAVALRSE